MTGQEVMDYPPCSPDFLGEVFSKRFATGAKVKQAVTFWLQHLTQISSTPGFKPWYHGLINDQLSMMTTYTSGVPYANHVPCILRNQNKVLDIRINVTLLLKLLCTRTVTEFFFSILCNTTIPTLAFTEVLIYTCVINKV